MKETENARAVLASLGIAIGQDFYTLRSSQVSGLLEEADRVKYRKPKNANGSRARYFHERLQRQALRDNAVAFSRKDLPRNLE